MFHVPFAANCVVSSHFIRNSKIEKNMKVRIRKFRRLYMNVASFRFSLLFFVSLGCLVREIPGVKIKNELLSLK